MAGVAIRCEVGESRAEEVEQRRAATGSARRERMRFAAATLLCLTLEAIVWTVVVPRSLYVCTDPFFPADFMFFFVGWVPGMDWIHHVAGDYYPQGSSRALVDVIYLLFLGAAALTGALASTTGSRHRFQYSLSALLV